MQAITLVGAALEYLVIASDCPDANPDELTDEYAIKSADVLSNGLRWFFCGGLAIALFCMSTQPTKTQLISSRDIAIACTCQLFEIKPPKAVSSCHQGRNMSRHASSPLVTHSQ
jgi:hypothetical protein